MELADRRLRNAFKQAGDEDETENYPTLAAIVRRLVGDERWRLSPNQAVIDVIKIAISKMPSEMLGRRAEQPQGRVGENAWKGAPERHIAELLYGYRDDEIPKRYSADGSEAVRTYDKDYLPTAYKIGRVENFEDRTRRRMTEVIRQDLALALLSLTVADLKQARGGQTERIFESPSDPSYICRESINAQLAEAVESGARFIVLVGHPGMGKTSLAERFLREIRDKGKATALVHVKKNRSDDYELDLVDLQEAFLQCQVDKSQSVSSDSQALFATLTIGKSAPAIVVLDNLDTTNGLLGLVPSQPDSTIIVTARQKGNYYPEGCRFIEVSTMTDDEAVRFFTSRLPHLSDDEVTALVSATRGYPLIMRYVCGMLTQNDLSVRRLLRGHGDPTLPWLPSDIWANIDTERDGPLHIVLARLVKSLADRDQLACELLVPMSFLGGLDRCSLRFLFAYAKQISPDVSQMRFTQAAQFIVNHSLASKDGEYLATHPHTRVILSEIFHSKYDEASDRTFRIRGEQREMMERYERIFDLPSGFELLTDGVSGLDYPDYAWEAKHRARAANEPQALASWEIPDWATIWYHIASPRFWRRYRERANSMHSDGDGS